MTLFDADPYKQGRSRQAEKSRRWRAAHPEKVRELGRARNRRTEREREANRRWTAANPEKVRAKNARWYAAHPEQARAAARRARAANPEPYARWRETNRATITEYQRRRSALRREATIVPFTNAQLEARMAFFGNRCWMCGGPFEHVDHVKPLAKGGAHALANLRPACQPCNNRKSDRWPYDPEQP